MTIIRSLLVAGALACLLLGAGCCSTSSTITPTAETSRPYYTIAPTSASSDPVATLSRMTTAPTTKEPTAQGPELELTILNHEWKRTGESTWKSIYVVGSAKNTGTQRIDYGVIDVKWFDTGGAVLGTTPHMVTKLDPGETYRFEIMYIGDTDESEVDRYTIVPGDLDNYS